MGGAAKWVASIAVTSALILAAVLVVAGRGDETELIRGNVALGARTIDFNSSTNWTVPDGVSTITISATGEHGADGFGLGGPGVTVTATVPVTPGERLNVRVATGPGDCSGVFRAVTASGAIVVAAGGGGAGEYVPAGNMLPRYWMGYGGAAIGARVPASPTPPGGTPGVTPDGYYASWPTGLFSSGRAGMYVGFGGSGGTSGFERPAYSNPQPTEVGSGGSFLAGGSGGRGGTTAELIQWIRGKNLLSADWPVTLTPQLGNGGRGGAGGCGYIGGQGGQGGSSGAGGGGGGGGLSFVEQGATDVSSNSNSMKLRKANVVISYAPAATSTIALVTTTVEAVTSTTQTPSTTTAPTTTSTVAPDVTQSATTIPSMTPSTAPATPTAPTYRAMNVYSLRTVVAVPTGVRVRSAKVAAASRRVCVVVREVVVTLASGTCKVTATVSNGRKKQKITATITVAP